MEVVESSGEVVESSGKVSVEGRNATFLMNHLVDHRENTSHSEKRCHTHRETSRPQIDVTHIDGNHSHSEKYVA